MSKSVEKRAKYPIAGLIAASLVLAAGPLMMSVSATAAEYEMRVGHVDTVDHPKHLAFLKFEELVEKRSDGRIDVQVFHGSQLGDERELLEGLQLGTVHTTAVSNGVIAPFSDRFSLLDIPFLFDGYEHARTVIDNNKELLFEGLDSRGMVGLDIWEQGFRNVSTAEEPVADLAALEGKKIRTMSAPLHVTAFRALGANPTPMSFSQLFTSMQQGVVDGEENPLYLMLQEHYYEVQNYVTLTRHIYDPLPVIASKRWLDSLPDDLKSVVVDSIHDVTDYERTTTERLVTEAAEELPKRGMEVIPMTEAQRQLYKEKAQPAVIKEVRKRLGDGIVDEWLEAVRSEA